MSDMGPSRRVTAERRRSAPKGEVTSDVRRWIGGVTGVSFGVLGAIALSWADPEPGRRGPGPLAMPHREAGLTCGACHRPETAVATACVQCHGSHGSTRPGHRRLREQGRLGCPDCHRVHRDFGGVHWTPAGRVIRFVPGYEVESSDIDSRGPKRATVALVAAEACAACHELGRADDPIARCLVAGHDELGPARPTVCFDEHRSWHEEALSSAVSRLPAWEAAREVAARHPVVDAPAPKRGAGWGWLVAAFGLAALGWGGARRVQARRSTPAPPPVRIEPPAIRRLPQVNTATCIGCNACVDACPYDVLELQRYIAVVARPDDCCGLTTCEQRCPNGSLVITDGAPIEERPNVGADLQSLDVPGVFLAGDLTGLPLIRNAINQGAMAVRSVQAYLQSRTTPDDDALDLVIIGAGPAGLSASLEAKAAGLRHVVLEQGSVAESIRSFPRGKLVFDQPLDVPLVGQLWLRESTKEELLGHWLRIVRRHRLPISSGMRVVGFESAPKGNLVVRAVRASGDETPHESASQNDGAPSSSGRLVRGTVDAAEERLCTRAVVLAIGRRGSPRKLPVPIPETLQHRVHYSLADARSFAGQRVVIVGLGDVAMEAAIALGGQPGTQVSVVYRGADFRRGKRRNIDAVRRLAHAGRITLYWRSDVEAVEADAWVLCAGDECTRLPWDAAFVMIGSIAPSALLKQLGIGQRVGSDDAKGAPRGRWEGVASERRRSPTRPVGPGRQTDGGDPVN